MQDRFMSAVEPRLRRIIHLDADAFFASVEQAADPRLRGKPIAVGGEKRGIIASASYEARKLGIYTPMPSALARRLCPKLVIIPGDFEKYELFSRLMFSYAYDFTPDVEIGSIDEGYFDLTACPKPAVDVAHTIQQAIRQSLRLSVSEGIATNKLISQVASKLKKPSAFLEVPKGAEAHFLAPLTNNWLPGIGPKTSAQLNSAGLVHIGQIAGTPADMLGLLVGRQAPQLRDFALGIDVRPIVPVRASAKSYGEQQTFAADTTDEAFIEATLRRMADNLMAKLRAEGKSMRTVTVKVRYNDMDEEQCSESLREPTDLESDIYGLIGKLMRKAWSRRVSLRLVSLKLSNVYDGRFGAALGIDPSSRQHQARQRLADVVDALREKHGTKVVFRGHDFVLDRPATKTASPTEATATTEVESRPHEDAITEHTTAERYKQAVVARQRLPNAIALRADKAAEVGRSRRERLPQEGVKETAPSTKATYQVLIRRPGALGVYIPLQVHSYYSFMDSTLSIRAIVEWAHRHELPAIALTDTNGLHGAVEFAQTAAARNIKPIIGTTLSHRGTPISLYVQNDVGYTNLCRILNRLQGRVGTAPGLSTFGSDDEESTAKGRARSESGPLRLHESALPRGGVRRSGALGESALPTAEELEGLLAISSDAQLARLFPGRFYQAISSAEDWRRRNPSLPHIAHLPVHYAMPGDRWKFDIVQSIRTLTLLRQRHAEKRMDGEWHFRTPIELERLFGTHPELAQHTRDLADRCNFQFRLGKPQFPAYKPPEGFTPAEYLKKLVMDGLRRRYPKDHQRLRHQLEEELGIITDVGYEEYFLVMWDILQECARRGIDWITRGSAADSLACYCLEISGVCPIRFDLYFRRFLNKDRMALNKLPDIDADFPHDRKDDVIDLTFEKYGPEHTALVGGFSTFQARSAFAEVAKVLGVADHQVRRITEHFPHYTRVGELQEAIGETRECQDLPLLEEPFSTAMEMAHFLDGFPRYPKMHPCGLVLSRQPMHEITPCFTSAKGYPTTHFDMDSVESVGLIKMDILAQGGLAAIRDVKQTLTARGDVTALRRFAMFGGETPEGSPWNDPAVWKMIADGGARAVHHIESPAMISLCRMCNVQDIDTLIAIVSVIRPGAANESKKQEFARRYQGLSPVRYPHPSLEPCLRSTFGLVVYEEHILQMCESFAGLPPGRADVLRRALGKEKLAVIEEIALEFATCARQRGRTEVEIKEVWELVTGFRGYAFCKAHSTAYGVEAYQSAWLKRYHPAEFMAAVLTNAKGFYHPLVYILECHNLGIPLLPPSINTPGPAFEVQNGAIRVPAVRAKGLTHKTIDRIIAERSRAPFTSLADFYLRVQPVPDEMDILIRAGAFDEFGIPRTQQYWSFKALCKNMDAAGQLWLLPPGNLDKLPEAPLTEPGILQRLQSEQELYDYPVSGHPLDLYPNVQWETYCPVNQLGRYIGQQVVTCGLVIEQRLFHQSTGEPMKFVTIADRTGIVETELFSRTYRSYGVDTVRYPVLEVTATVEPFENGGGHTLRVHRTSRPRTAA